MEPNNEKEVIKSWKKEGKKLIAPSVFYAVDKSGIKYFVFRDSSSILFMIPEKCDTTFTIPKKYCKKKTTKSGVNYYEILNRENMSIVSCIGSKTEYEKFVLDNLVINPTC